MGPFDDGGEDGSVDEGENTDTRYLEEVGIDMEEFDRSPTTMSSTDEATEFEHQPHHGPKLD